MIIMHVDHIDDHYVDHIDDHHVDHIDDHHIRDDGNVQSSPW